MGQETQEALASAAAITADCGAPVAVVALAASAALERLVSALLVDDE